MSLTYTLDATSYPNLSSAMLQSSIGTGPVTLTLANTPSSANLRHLIAASRSGPGERISSVVDRPNERVPVRR